MNDEMPRSIGQPKDSEQSYEFENSVLRLHSVLTRLDEAIFDALRAIDVALGRTVTEDPKRLPMREIGRLRHHLEVASGRSDEPVRPKLHEIALEHADVEEQTPPGRRIAGVVPMKNAGRAR